MNPDCPFSRGAIAIATAAFRRLLSFWIRVGWLSRLEVIRLRKSSENDRSPMFLFSVLSIQGVSSRRRRVVLL